MDKGFGVRQAWAEVAMPLSASDVTLNKFLEGTKPQPFHLLNGSSNNENTLTSLLLRSFTCDRLLKESTSSIFPFFYGGIILV